MEIQKPTVSQNKLELLVAIGFGLIIIGSAGTSIGYIPLADGRYLDMAIIPAVFAAMIGGYRVGVPVAGLWAFLAFRNIGIDGDMATFYTLLISNLVLVTTVYAAYKVCKKIYQYSPANVYRAVLLGVTAKALVANFLIVIRSLIDTGTFKMEGWGPYAAQEYLLELALCCLAMMLLIKHLRQIHILNGVKRREKAVHAADLKASNTHYQEG